MSHLTQTLTAAACCPGHCRNGNHKIAIVILYRRADEGRRGGRGVVRGEGRLIWRRHDSRQPPLGGGSRRLLLGCKKQVNRWRKAGARGSCVCRTESHDA